MFDGKLASWREQEDEALIIRDHRNAAYTQGWRDRDEQEDGDE